MTLIAKFALPAILFVAGFSAGMITSKKLEKPVTIPKYECPACNCPPQANTIDFDKIKGFKGTINLNQTYQITANRDSIIMERIRGVVKDELNGVRVARCR